MGIDLGIFNDIDGRTNNDSGDGDTGANDLQNFPVITSATSSGGSTTIQGTLNSTPNTTFTVQFFSNPKSSKDEGKIFLGEKTDVSTDANGDATFSISVPEEVKGFVTATATDSSGNTSEFSDPLKIKRVRT